MPVVSIAPVSPVIRLDSSRAQPARYVVSGVTRDQGTLAVIGGCTVSVFETTTNRFMGTVVSDATTGVYSVDVPSGETGFVFRAVAVTGDGVKVGATVSTLVGSAQ
jgi:hypothetical protein